MPLFLADHCGRHPVRTYHPIPLGAAVVITDIARLPEEFDLVGYAEANPWAPFAVLENGHPGSARPWRLHPPLRDLIVLYCAQQEAEVQLRKHFVAVGAPEPREIVDYISAALPDPALARDLLAELTEQEHPPRSTRYATYRKHGPLTATDWSWLHAIVRVRSFEGRLKLSDAAARLRVDPRTLKKSLRRIFQMNWEDVAAGYGWKWVVEQALRVHGYVGESGGEAARGQEGNRARGQEGKRARRNVA